MEQLNFCRQLVKQIVNLVGIPSLAPELRTRALQLLDLEAEAEQLRTAAQAVIDRWDTPHWKAVPATAEYIGRLRAALGEKQ